VVDAVDAEAYDIGTVPAVRFSNWVTESTSTASDKAACDDASDQFLAILAAGSSSSGSGDRGAAESAERLRRVSQALWRALASEKRLAHYTPAEQEAVQRAIAWRVAYAAAREANSQAAAGAAAAREASLRAARTTATATANSIPAGASAAATANKLDGALNAAGPAGGLPGGGSGRAWAAVERRAAELSSLWQLAMRADVNG
jgi:hypothetical protein